MLININDATVQIAIYNVYWLNLLNYSFLLKSDVLACWNTNNKEDGAFLEVESIVVALLLSPSRASLIESVCNCVI